MANGTGKEEQTGINRRMCIVILLPYLCKAGQGPAVRHAVFKSITKQHILRWPQMANDTDKGVATGTSRRKHIAILQCLFTKHAGAPLCIVQCSSDRFSDDHWQKTSAMLRFCHKSAESITTQAQNQPPTQQPSTVLPFLARPKLCCRTQHTPPGGRCISRQARASQQTERFKPAD
jgi:hypothetical protein